MLGRSVRKGQLVYNFDCLTRLARITTLQQVLLPTSNAVPTNENSGSKTYDGGCMANDYWLDLALRRNL